MPVTLPALVNPPPDYSGFEPLVIPSTGGEFVLDPDVDYEIVAPFTITGPVSIIDGRDWVWIKGHIQIDDQGPDAIADSSRRGLTIADSADAVLTDGRVAYVEGLLVNGDDLDEAIDLACPSANVYLTNIEAYGIHFRGSDDRDGTGDYVGGGNHPNGLQTWGGFKELWIDGLNLTHAYEGLRLQNDHGSPNGPVHLRRVNIEAIGMGSEEGLVYHGHTNLAWARDVDRAGVLYIDQGTVFSQHDPDGGWVEADPNDRVWPSPFDELDFPGGHYFGRAGAIVESTFTPAATDYDWEASGVSGWQANNATSVSRDTAVKHDGAASLKVRGVFGTGFTAINPVGPSETVLDKSGAGGFLRAWVYMPTLNVAGGSVGSGWSATIEVRDSSFSPHQSPAVDLTPGSWTEIVFDAADYLDDVEKYGVSVKRSSGTAMTVDFQVDSIQRGTQSYLTAYLLDPPPGTSTATDAFHVNPATVTTGTDGIGPYVALDHDDVRLEGDPAGGAAPRIYAMAPTAEAAIPSGNAGLTYPALTPGQNEDVPRYLISHIALDATDGYAIQNAKVEVLESDGATLVDDLYEDREGGAPVDYLTTDAHGRVQGFVETSRTVVLRVSDNGNTAYRSGVPGVLLNFSDDVFFYAVAFVGLTGVTALTIQTSALPDGAPDVAYEAILEATGGVEPYFWEVVEFALPAGLVLDSETGVISGTPTGPEAGAFTVLVTDADGKTAAASITLDVVELLITTRTPTAARVGVAYSFQLLADGGDGVYTWTEVDALPAGLVLDATGLVTGTPTTVQTLDADVMVEDSSEHSTTSAIHFVVASATSTVPDVVIDTEGDALTPGLVGQDYSFPLAAHGGSGALTWVVSAGTLPPGLTLAPGGLLVGRPTTGGDYVFTALVQDAENPPKTDQQVFGIQVSTPVVSETYDGSTIPPTALVVKDGTNVTSVGGRWRVFGGTNYTTTALRDYNDFGAKVQVFPDPDLTTVFRHVPSPGTTDDTILSFATVQSPGSNVILRTFQDSVEDEVVHASVVLGSGDFLQHRFDADTAEWVYERSTSSIDGPWTELHRVTVVDVADVTALAARVRAGGDTAQYSEFDNLTIYPLSGGGGGVTTPTVTTSTLPNAVQGTAYSSTLTSSGGTGSKVWSVASGTLPAGLLLNASTGVISGTPSGTGSSSFTVRVTVGGVASPTKTLGIDVSSPGATVYYAGPVPGTIALTSLIPDQEITFWSNPKNAFVKMVELGFDGFGFGGLGEVFGHGSRWDDHSFLWTRSGGTSYNDLGQALGGVSGIQNVGLNKFGVRAFCQFYMPGGYAASNPIIWRNETWVSDWERRVGNTIKFLTGAPVWSQPWDGIWLDDEADESFNVDYVIANQGGTEAQIRQAAYNVGRRIGLAIKNNWNTSRVGHGPWVGAYAFDIWPDSWQDHTQRSVNGAPAGWADRFLFREFLAGMNSAGGITYWDTTAVFYRHAQGSAPGGSGDDYAAAWNKTHWRTMLNYNNPSDPFNPYRMFAHPEEFGISALAWWDGNQSPESFPHPNQTGPDALSEINAIKSDLEGSFWVFFFSSFDPDLDLRNFSAAITAYP